MAEMTIEQRRAVALAKAKAAAAGAAPKGTGNQHVDASTVYVDDMLFGLPGKAAAGLNALVRSPFTDKSLGEEYDTLRNQYQNARQQYADEHPVANAAASIAGAIHGGGVTGRGLGMAAERVAPAVVARLGQSFAGRMAGDAISGGVQGGLSAYGHDEDVGTGAGIGAVVGGAARPVTALAGGALSSLGSLVGLGNNSRAQNAIAEAILRSGRNADDVADELTRAAQQGQPEFMVADALGNSGQRMLSGVARSPGDMRQTIAETLQRRQAGQTDRLVNALSEGFDAPQTAAQTRTAMTAARDAAADTNYTAARQSAGAVDPTDAIRRADDFLQPGATGVMSNQTNIADDSIESAVRRARGYLTDGNSVLTDFNAAFRAKRELDSMIENGNNAIRSQLIPIRNSLDDSLAAASDPYAAARDQFRRESQAIGAIDQGAEAASARTRAADNIEGFQQLAPDQQQPFRVGYVDPLIARTEAASMSPTTNKARALITGKTVQEFPAFAAPGRGDVMGERIAREQRMFETANQALGGSRTADNLADATEMMGFDPTILGIAGNALTGNIRSAGMQALQRGVNLVQGRNQGTRDMIARMLLQSEPTQARAEMAAAVRKGQTLTRAQQAIINSIIGAGSTEYSR
ncbi:hypothetical protein LPB79_13245 [Rhizobium sp. T136]|uniref:hypothetical protein n=1 Tax=Rhizobium sp. T136 TaxID=555319 RepID=UPI001E636E7D|nr:hypothetical protein [Rhizobium sp. T136]UFS83213.1 hypothetical protein LPB79_13245 [Rhizobium sp. T136]